VLAYLSFRIVASGLSHLRLLDPVRALAELAIPRRFRSLGVQRDANPSYFFRSEAIASGATL
jgi:hypothetical protein